MPYCTAWVLHLFVILPEASYLFLKDLAVSQRTTGLENNRNVTLLDEKCHGLGEVIATETGTNTGRPRRSPSSTPPKTHWRPGSTLAQYWPALH